MTPFRASAAVLLVAAFGACQKRAAESLPATPPGPVAASANINKAPAPTTEGSAPSYAPRVEVAVTEEGFVPSRIAAKAGQALTLVITRKTERTCANEILFAGREGKTDLPLGKPVEVTYTPKAAGEVKFGCAMGMMIGGVLAVGD
jgi:plastocyanin